MFKIGDIVQCGVYVCNEYKRTCIGEVVQVSNDGSVCKVDKGSLHGCSPYYVYEASTDLRLFTVQ